MSNTERKSIFVWRAETQNIRLQGRKFNCQWCGSKLDWYDLEPVIKMVYHAGFEREAVYERPCSHCCLCGWRQSAETYFHDLLGKHGIPFHGGHYLGGDDSVTTSMLREFEIDSPGIAVSELATHLKKNFSDVYALDPWRFEEVVNDVFRAHGYKTILTQRRKDDGADIIIIGGDNDYIGIVECKRYSKNRKIGVELIKQLMGTIIQWDLRRACFITTSDFTSGARAVATEYIKRGYEFDLKAASDVLKMLNVYNETLPPLDKLNKAIRDEILKANQRKQIAD